MDTITIEVIQKIGSKACKLSAIQLCETYLKCKEVVPGSIINNFDENVAEHIHSLIIGDSETLLKVDLPKVNINWYVYKLNNSGPFIDTTMCGDQEHTLAESWMLPSADFHGMWESLIYDTDIKENLLRYVQTTMLFSERGVDANIVCSNRVVLLHGPPGTGKTSLCKALAHKLAARLKNKYVRAQLVEINSHSLFSKWFSESGKLVTTMFNKIRDVIEEPETLVCVLIDEVESLAHAREQCLAGTEPSDSIRVVNAVLTQIDQIKRYPNVLILTTSNMTGAIDLAFVDRADIKQFIGLPSTSAIYQIYYSCLRELMRCEVIAPAAVIMPVNALKMDNFEQNCPCEHSKELKQISTASEGLSGRTLRKIPFITHAMFLMADVVSIQIFLNGMKLAVEYFKKQTLHFKSTMRRT